MLNDLRHAVRTLSRVRGASAAVIAAMALGIGATTAMVSVIDGVLLRPLPFPASDRIVSLETFDLENPARLSGLSNPWDIADWKRQARSFSALAAWSTDEVTLQSVNGPVRVEMARVGEGMGDALGVRAVIGRLFEASDYTGNARVAVLGHALWRTQFGGDTALVGRSIDVSGFDYTVVGVLEPARIAFPVEGRSLWLPLVLPAADAEGTQRAGVWMRALARLAPDVPIERARTEMETIVAGLRERSPATNGTRAIAVRPLRDFIAGPARSVLLLIAGAVTLVLLVACASVGNVLLARAQDRRRELALRSALGASLHGLARLLLAETVVLTAAGATLGVLLAPLALRALQSLYPGGLPRTDAIALDARVLAFALLATTLAAFLASIPALMQTRNADLQATLRAGDRGLGSRRERRVRAGLVVAQVALSAALLFAGSQLARSFVSLSRTDTGFDAQRLVTFSVALSGARYPDVAREQSFHTAALERIRAIAAVESAGAATLVPFVAGDYLDGFRREGHTDELPDMPIARLQFISPGYLETLDVPIVAGRLPTALDNADGARVAIVNQALERRWFPAGAMGQRILARGEWREIVGVVGDKRHTDLRSAPAPDLYLPQAQNPEAWLSAWYVVRARGDGAGLRTALQQAIAGIDPTIAAAGFATMETRLSQVLAPDRFRAWMVGALAALALALALLGLWGLLAWTISRETREIGIRAALGQTPPAALTGVVVRALRLCAAGLAIGLGIALLSARILAAFLAGVAPRDPVTAAVVSLTILVFAALAAAGPGWRASRVDPLVALRSD